LIALLIPILYYILPKNHAIIALAIFTILYIAVDYIRLHLKSANKSFMLLFGQMLRRREEHSFTGGSYLLLASLVAVFLFPDPGVFIAAISFLVIGDTVAALVGLRYGHQRIFRKSIEGTLACLVSCLVIAYIISILPNKSLPITIGVIGAVVATVVEALPVEINDNVVIPIISGAVMQIIKLFL
jgi:glycerol-3-phosphate acyltransferase PlsY